MTVYFDVHKLIEQALQTCCLRMAGVAVPVQLPCVCARWTPTCPCVHALQQAHHLTALRRGRRSATPGPQLSEPLQSLLLPLLGPKRPGRHRVSPRCAWSTPADIRARTGTGHSSITALLPRGGRTAEAYRGLAVIPGERCCRRAPHVHLRSRLHRGWCKGHPLNLQPRSSSVNHLLSNSRCAAALASSSFAASKPCSWGPCLCALHLWCLCCSDSARSALPGLSAAQLRIC